MNAASDVTIRPVQVVDAEAINEIRRQPRVVEFSFALPDEPIEATRRFLESLGANDYVLVAELDGRVVGMAGLHRKQGKLAHSAHIGMLVHDGFQRRGIGRRLLEALLEIGDRQLGLTRLELEVMADNIGAIRLYEQCGFVVEGRKRDAVMRPGGFVDLLVMGRLR